MFKSIKSTQNNYTRVISYLNLYKQSLRKIHLNVQPVSNRKLALSSHIGTYSSVYRKRSNQLDLICELFKAVCINLILRGTPNGRGH